MATAPIQVTTPFLPEFRAYTDLLQGVWERNHLTNQGPLVRELESRIPTHLGLERPVLCVANGGLGLQLLLKAMDVRGTVITTPFSYVATSSCPAWEGLDVRFADIESDHLTLDPAAVEASIDSSSEAIIATHVFGNPCAVDSLARIADKHGLALIYDAAHAWGVRHQGKSILSFGHASMVSTHATKLFHTVEGGFVTAAAPDVMDRVEWMRRFGHKDNDSFHGIGINAKMSEMHAAMGLAVMDRLGEISGRREKICQTYKEALANQSEIRPAFALRSDTEWNHSYFPVLFESEKNLLRAVQRMGQDDIHPRRYFYPCLNQSFSTDDRDGCPVSSDISRRILCLPLSHALTDAELARVIRALGLAA
ncbi:DegT/DnrJ/EryC1/StrS family aminotransferase [Haloferula rosea]|uniref:DegT/DnrJ/EryC1/StrS family aminotransferase n=1 Tax=Haloferula rosea TaxID=490093 RepID=A0A934RDD9_9BACT|nr:DegT/DnrJ/EryC1/StrS family aminotransferase [Haloferula rosea]MBK1827517.1 DegT/DnrJ/EryC1/StrS family aminotransferase [Haloferula rosea]